jgi:hypothetical protein
MVTVDLGVPIAPDLQIARANAIQAYANMEQSLCTLFAYLLATVPEKAGVVFFRITNTNSRNNILSSLLGLMHESRFDAFWYGAQGQLGILKLIRQLDQRRNEIVHWHVVDNIDLEKQTRQQTLAPPNFWALAKNMGSAISITDLVEFCTKADFVQRLLIMFWVIQTQPATNLPEPERQTWLDIFARPIAYPPPDTHPLSRNYKAPQTPPQSSQG